MVANYDFIDDITVPDDMQIAAGSTFVKVWRLRNNGSVPWGEGFTLRHKDGEAMTTETTQALPPCPLNEFADVTLELTAPATPGTYRTDWYLHDAAGNIFGEFPVYAQINVVAAANLQAAPDAEFAADLTIPDDTVIGFGEAFEKKWLIRNKGNIAWTDAFKLVWVDGKQMGAPDSVALPATNVGDVAEVAITFTAPSNPGTAFSDWQCADASGNKFGNLVYVRINAQQVDESGVDDATSVKDVTIPDDTRMKVGNKFKKVWLARNTGTTTWTSAYSLRYIGGEAMTEKTSVPLGGDVAPGEEIQLSVDFTAPDTNGTHYSDWKLHDEGGNAFGDFFWTRIVAEGATTSTGSGSGSGSGQAQQTNPFEGIQLQAPIPQFYSQRDPRWGKRRLGTGNVTIEQWGCMMTCNAMILTWKGIRFDPGTLNTYMTNNGIYSQGFLTPWNTATLVNGNVSFDFRLIKQGMENLVFGTFLGTIVSGQNMLQKVDEYLARGIPVMLNVDITPQNAYNSNDTHWVVAVHKLDNDYLVYDPAEMNDAVISLQRKYGRSNNNLADAIVQAVLYH